MNSKRLYFVLLASIALLFVGLIAGAYQATTLLAKDANELLTLKAKSEAVSREQLSLAKAKKDLKQYADLNKITRTIVPEDKSQAEAVREIVKIAETNGVKLSAISFPSSTLGTVKGGSAATSGAAAVAPRLSNPATDKLSQLVAVPGIVGVYQLSINVESDNQKPITYSRFISFLSGLERNRRTAQVSNISIQPKKEDPSLLTFKLSLNEYIKP